MESLEEGGFAIKRIKLHVRGHVPDIDPATFEKVAKKADRGCPVSNLLRPGLEIELNVELVNYPETNLN